MRRNVTINRNKMDDKNNIEEIAEVLSRTKNKDLIFDFFESILTETELKTVSSRWEIVKLLDQGITQRKIARDLHLSLCKITRGSKELKKENSPLKKLIHKVD